MTAVVPCMTICSINTEDNFLFSFNTKNKVEYKNQKQWWGRNWMKAVKDTNFELCKVQHDKYN